MEISSILCILTVVVVPSNNLRSVKYCCIILCSFSHLCSRQSLTQTCKVYLRDQGNHYRKVKDSLCFESRSMWMTLPKQNIRFLLSQELNTDFPTSFSFPFDFLPSIWSAAIKITTWTPLNYFIIIKLCIFYYLLHNALKRYRFIFEGMK